MGKIMGSPTGPLIPGAQVRPIPSLDLANPEVHILPYLIQSEQMGVDATTLGYAVNALVDGAYATDYYIGGDKIDLTIIGNPTSVQAIAGLAVVADRNAQRTTGSARVIGPDRELERPRTSQSSRASAGDHDRSFTAT